MSRKRSHLDEDRWNNLWERFCDAKAPTGLFQKLAAAYNEPYRAYHTTEHILHCLGEFDRARDLIRWPDELEMALWFHDAVYDTHAADNEEKSADWAQRALLLNKCPAEIVTRIHDLVMTTKHSTPLIEKDAQLIADIDLSSLGQPEPDFLNNELNIRTEYQWVPEKLYQEERVKILTSFLQRRRIYFTDYFESLYESQARKNLKDALNRLKGFGKHV
jgi:predicted metal-dependent HD superfamily phosphohydrolase